MSGKPTFTCRNAVTAEHSSEEANNYEEIPDVKKAVVILSSAAISNGG